MQAHRLNLELAPLDLRDSQVPVVVQDALLEWLGHASQEKENKKNTKQEQAKCCASGKEARASTLLRESKPV
jgi:hypothetical protein